MCFDRGTQKKKLDNFLIFFQVCRLFDAIPPPDTFLCSIISLARMNFPWKSTSWYRTPWRYPILFMRQCLFFDQLLQAVRPKLQMAKSLEEAANAVDEMLNAVFQNANGKK